VGKTYCVRVTAAVSSVTGAELHTFQVTGQDMDDLAVAGDAMALTSSERSTLYAGIWTYTTPTLTSLSALLSSVAAAIWAYATRTLTQTAASVTAAVTGSTLSITAAATYSATLTGLTVPATWTKCWLTIKEDDSHTDAQSIVQIVVSEPAAETDGLLYLNKASGTLAQGSLTVDQPNGTVTITITDEATAQLGRASSLSYDVKVLTSTGTTDVLTEGSAVVSLTETRAIT